jgi:PAS domain S-box-containing protein
MLALSITVRFARVAGGRAVQNRKVGDPLNASMGLGLAGRVAPVQALWLAIPAMLTALLFYLDLYASDRMIFGLPYLLVVILAESFGGATVAMVAAAVSSLLVLAAPMLSGTIYVAEPAWMVAVGRTAVVATMSMMVLYLRQRDTARASLREKEEEAVPAAAQRSDEIRLVNAQLHREIAERRRAELRSGYLASIVESSADAIIGQSLSGAIVSWNNGATRVYGHKREDVIGKPTSCLVPPQHEKELTGLLARVARGERVDEVESVRRRSDGTEFDVSASFSPILDDKGTIIGVSMIERDISRRMRAEEALQSLNTELEEKVKQRTEELESAVGELEAFSYSVSHDLRAPLRALRGFSGTLLEDAAPSLRDIDRDMLERIDRAAGRMDGIIEDLLALSRAGNHRIVKEVVNLGDIARGVIDELRAATPDRKVSWKIGDGLLAWGDAGLLRLVVQNLLGNAFKYTEQKDAAEIELAVEHRAAEAVTYVVRDNGIGFDGNLADKLFRPFSRLHRSDEVEGSGIGLATVERIVRRHGGTVFADGEKGIGATFRFRLPVPPRARSTDDDSFVEDAPRGANA